MFRNSHTDYMLRECSSDEAVQQIVNYLSNYDPVFQEILSQENLISSLMVMKEGYLNDSSRLIDGLLYYSPFCYMMTPYEEFLYLTCRYPNCTMKHEIPLFNVAASTSLSTSSRPWTIASASRPQTPTIS